MKLCGTRRFITQMPTSTMPKAANTRRERGKRPHDRTAVEEVSARKEEVDIAENAVFLFSTRGRRKSDITGLNVSATIVEMITDSDRDGKLPVKLSGDARRKLTGTNTAHRTSDMAIRGCPGCASPSSLRLVGREMLLVHDAVPFSTTTMASSTTILARISPQREQVERAESTGSVPPHPKGLLHTKESTGFRWAVRVTSPGENPTLRGGGADGRNPPTFPLSLPIRQSMTERQFFIICGRWATKSRWARTSRCERPAPR